MAFIDQFLPMPRLIHGLEKELLLPTTVVGNGTTEYRINKVANPRRRWRYPARLVPYADLVTLVTFYQTVALGSLNSFKFRDPDTDVIHRVRFDQLSIQWTMDALTMSNRSAGNTQGDITLVEVIE